ncbi:serine/threonine protein kinase [Amycolatopsis pretoriensis]|uniref:non-specific serine/threonine protein kinase n=1 Tax=Amycolatopsis pretoriensis TaxID=218821 RepID=A0A1H5QVP5_9PSEU|nr:serine/threonine-protein kinase [Amycolatopsis pretoriensis]SEF30222.1 serine/threonine protein kinase [Amycolatopsis pretoriensis]
MLSSGQLLAERYKLTSRIAVGGMGEVWQASDTRLDRTVAVKILKAELSGDAEFLHRFRTEARMTASLNHPGIAAVHDYGETVFDGDLSIAYLVMELVDGDPLAGLLAKHGRLSAEFTLDMLEQAGNALQAAHEQGLVHRDVKPGNILVTSAGQVKITDFGVAKAADAAPVTRSGMVMGTAHYIAPEQALGHPAEPASDVYSLAVCGYECLAGHRPFLSENAVTVAMMHIRDIAPPLPPDVPPAARAVIEATLVKDPRQRYNSGGEFAAAVAAVRAGLPLPTPRGLVNASYSTGQQPVVPQPQQQQPVQQPVPQQPVPPQQQHMPVGPQSPAVNPMVAIGPPSRPVLRPAMVPAPRKKSQWGWWALLAAILLVVLVAAIVLVAKMIGSSGSPPHTGQTQSQVVPGRQPPAEEPPVSSAIPAESPGTTDDGQQGIMTAPWTEWNGTQR